MSIRLLNLTKRFADSVAVDRVSLEIAEGELFTLLGTSGSGKSTILRLVAGLSLPDEGRIELNGRDVTDLPPQARGTGFVFQNYSIFRHMTVAENVEFGLRIRRVQPEERRRRRDELLDLVGLAGLQDRYADQLSGGQQQRVALARALAYHPDVLLLDEPFGALDVQIRTQLRRSLKEIQRQLQVTTILVTHDQEEAFEVADRVGVLDRGHLVEVGTAEALYHHPRTEFVATFIGGGNVVVGREDGGRIRLGQVWLPLPERAIPHEPNATVRVLFRPESVQVRDEPASPRTDRFPIGRGRVVRQSFAGPMIRLTLEAEDLKGARPLPPLLGYAEPTTYIEAVMSSGEDTAQHLERDRAVWLALRDYHVLAPTGLKVLIAVDHPPGPQPAVEFGLHLVDATGGIATLLTVVDAGEDVAGTKDALEALRARSSMPAPRLEARVRRGDSTTEILLEAQEGLYEVVVIGRQGSRQQVPGFGTTARRVLTRAHLPVLILQAARPEIKRVLICTAAGEPGKVDIRFGGRIAHRAGARATVLHIPRTTSKEAAKRADRHLRQAERYLTSLGVPAEVSTLQGPLVETIANEAERGDYDLIVIGAPAPNGRHRLRSRDYAAEIVGAIRRPVLVVPMPE